MMTEHDQWLMLTQEEALEPELPICDSHHHLRKLGAADPLDEVSGTTGLTGAADTVAVMRRADGLTRVQLLVTGRDVENKGLALRFDKSRCSWILIGRAEIYSQGVLC